MIFSTQLVITIAQDTTKDVSQSNEHVRCADSHALFLKKASRYGFTCIDCTGEFNKFPSCNFGLELECKLFYRRIQDVGDVSSKRKNQINKKERNSKRREK